MPKTKTQNKTEVNGKGKELDDIVNGIIKKCKDTIVEYKNKKKNDTHHHCESKNIGYWNIIIDNIPVHFVLNCDVFTLHENNGYKLKLERDINWNGLIYLGENEESFNHHSLEVKVDNDVIDKNDITRIIIDLFNFDNLKFCKINNKFIEKDNIFSKAINYFDLKCENIDECCVCYDKTTIRTKKCKHHICLECLPKIKTFIPYNSPNYINCPMCKQRVKEMNSENDNTENASDYNSDED
jgi:hypothetical protein